MPQLRVYIEVGICSGYGDGDYGVRVGMIERLTAKQMEQLTLASHHALTCAWDTWRKAQPQDQAGSAQSSTPPSPIAGT